MPAQDIDAAGPATQSLTVSLEDHLARALRTALPLLPNSVASDLREVLDAPLPEVVRGHIDTHGLGHGDPIPPPPVRTIPYALLSAISRWARTPEGAAALARHEPPLSPHNYAMVSLLAGTRTCPDRRYPSVPVPGTDDDAQAAQRRD
ncbi:hypothetical protein BN946_scf184951.g16 [Trametes cinnabarina]|uniref:Uncharacterized protein n=1 Tax=Pycnoporus cinnabarinus TaxID=5643 RepID=A0A060STR8_PYCCI|nr:hypothetical protein BN946_scf184951.g16 [Trametes cinnabarina]